MQLVALNTDLIFFFQSFIWPLARPANPDETISVELRTQTTKILLKTGIVSASTSRGTITSSSKVVGQYVMLMQGIYKRIIFLLKSLIPNGFYNPSIVRVMKVVSLTFI